MRFMLFLVLPVLLWGQSADFVDIQVEKASGGHRFLEGPIWSRSVGGLLFCDVPRSMILAFVDGQGVGKYREEAGGASGLSYEGEGRLIAAQSKARRVVRLVAVPGKPEQKEELLVERFEGKRLNGPNDVVVRKDGHIYFTDPAFGSQTDKQELPFHGIYHLPPKGPLSLIAKPKGRPNGIALSPNGRVLYVSNSDERRVYAYDLDGKGIAGNERLLIDGIQGVPDGIKTDEKGHIFVAATHVEIYSAEGKPVYTMHVAEKPSNLAFGEEDFKTLYITAKSSLYRASMKWKGAHAESKSQ